MGRRPRAARGAQNGAHPTPKVPVELGGETYHLRFTNRSVVLMEEETGWTITELQNAMERGSMRAITALVWGGLLHAQPRLAFLDAADLVEPTRISEVAEAAGRALSLAYGVDPDEEDEPTEHEKALEEFDAELGAEDDPGNAEADRD